MDFQRLVAELKLDDLLRRMNDFIFFVLDESRILMKVRGDQSVLEKVSLSQYEGESYLEYVVLEDQARLEKLLDRVFEGRTGQGEYRVTDLEGERLYINVAFFPLFEGDRVVGAFGITNELSTVRALEEEEMRRIQTYFEIFTKYAEELLVVVDREGNVLNAPFTRQVTDTFSLHMKVDESIYSYLSKASAKQLRHLLKRAGDGRIERFETELHVIDYYGLERVVHCAAVNYLSNESIQGIVLQLRDISKVKEKEEEVELLSTVDCLTQLNNRRYLEERLTQLIVTNQRSHKSFALIIMTIDDLSSIRSMIGYRAVDDVLFSVAQRLKEHCAEASSVLARISGDEFAIVTRPLNRRTSLKELLSQLIDLFKRPFSIKGLNIQLEATFGVSMLEKRHESYPSLVDEAHIALFLAKRDRLPYSIYSAELSFDTFQTHEIFQRLNGAVERGELFVQFQPIFQGATQEIVAFETLVRWEHPELGIVSPAQFIPIAEENGWMTDIGMFVFEKVCEAYESLQLSERNIFLAYNLSPVQLMDDQLVGRMKHYLQKYDVPAERIIIELTETAKLPREKYVADRIRSLQRVGFDFALDDFGTGYSSFEHLQTIRPAYVKIDRSVVQTMEESEVSLAFLRSTISLADSLSIQVIAEGIERDEQAQQLEKVGVDWLQGYLYGRPVSLKTVRHLLQGRVTSTEGRIYDERRRYFRVDLRERLVADMTIDSLNGKSVQLGSTKVLIENIGPGGARIISDIRLPKNSSFVLKIQMTLFGEEHTCFGKVVYMKEENSYYTYGLEWNVSEERRNVYIRLFNHLQVNVRGSKSLQQTPTERRLPTLFFKEQRESLA